MQRFSTIDDHRQVILHFHHRQSSSSRLFRHDWLVKNFRNDRQISPKSNTKFVHCQEKFLADLKSICDQSETSDVLIRVHSQTYPCHRAILCARSLYFQKLFQSEFSEKSRREIDLSSFLPDEYTFELLHRYLYKGECQLNDDNLSQYLQLSDQFLLDELVDLCEEYLLVDEHIHETNVWIILEIFNRIGRKISSAIQEKCFCVLKNNRHLINEQCQNLLRQYPQLSIDLLKYFV